MPEISNKKNKFIKRNFERLSVEELASKTGLTHAAIKSIISEYTSDSSGETHRGAKEKEPVITLSLKVILLTFLLFAAITIIIYWPSLTGGDFILDDKRAIKDNPLIHITRISQLFDILFSKEIGRRIGHASFALNYYLADSIPLGIFW